MFKKPKPKLVEDGYELKATYLPEHKPSAEHLANRMGAEVRNFHVLIHNYDPKTGEVLAWSKRAGYSVWYKVG